MKVFNYTIEFHTSAKAPWKRFRVYDIQESRFGPSYGKHLVWGRLSLVFGQPHLLPITVCGHCYEAIERVGEDALDWCESCQSIEGPTVELTMEEYEARG
jgi:hypothetical protein